MTPRAEKRHKIEVHGRIFFWSLNHRYGNFWREFEPPAVHILSHDKEFEVYYQLRQSYKGRPRIDIRKGFPELPAEVQPPCCVEVPVWDDEKATKRLVRQILDWCTNDDRGFWPTSVTVRSNTGDDAFREMIRQLDGLPRLEELYLRSTEISDTGMRLVSDLRSLQTLYIIKGPITDAGLACLEALSELKSLCLAEVNVTDVGLRHLSNLHNLDRLWLNGTTVSDAGLEIIAGLPKLFHVDLAATLVSAEGRQFLRGKLLRAQVLPQ